ncbi:hypothetical protein [Peterkaempfera sp. SMS 1(5)a]|uniref:hypothetical protein n=1 Tax=Peterkaempfera podocarpi TaxID=3232308 RepID=UPI00366C116F
MSAPTRLLAVAVALAGCTVLASCGSAAPSAGKDAAQSAGPSGPSGPATPSPAPAASSPGVPAVSSPAVSSPAGDTASGPAAGTVDPCALLTAAEAQPVLHSALGTGRKVTTGDLTECVYNASGVLVVAVLKSSFTAESFQQLIKSQDAGPYGATTGKSQAVAGLGDAAYSYDKAGIIEVLKGSTVLSVTSGSTATSKGIARAVLPHLP